MTNYVVGIITDGKRVLLIKKNRPQNQVGLYNGIGGIVKENELPVDAMIRKAKSETDLDITNWNIIDTFEYPSSKITLHLFKAKVSKKFIKDYKTTTDEVVRIFKIKKLPQNSYIDIEYICKNRLI